MKGKIPANPAAAFGPEGVRNLYVSAARVLGGVDRFPAGDCCISE